MVRKGVGERHLIMLGIDVSKDTLTCALVNNDRKIIWEEVIPNTQAGISTFLDKIAVKTPMVLEPTGRYGQTLVQIALLDGRDVRMAPTRKAKKYLESVQSRAKTDKLDSRGLAQYGLSANLVAYPVKEPDVDKLDQLLSVRKGLTKSITNLQLQQQSLPLAAEILKAPLADLKRHLKDLDARIAEFIKQTPAFEAVARLDAIPGIGPVTAAAVCSRLVGKSFSHPDKFVAYCGMDIGVRDSGKRRGQIGLTKQGDAELRRLFYCAAQANLRCKSSPFKDQYQKERDKGMSSTAALCAVARKLAKVCWSLHKHGTTFEASRVGTQKTVETHVPEISTQPSAQPMEQKQAENEQAASPFVDQNERRDHQAHRVDPISGAWVAPQQSPILPDGQIIVSECIVTIPAQRSPLDRKKRKT